MTTPNLGMDLPPDGDTNWGGKIRGALSTLDSVFSGIATERTLRNFMANMNFARDSIDRLRIVNEGGTVSTYAYWGNGNTVPNTLYSTTGAHIAMDARETHRAQTQMAARQRRTRWTVT